MNDYEPVSRRPIARMFRATARAPVRACVWLDIHPDWISMSSIAAWAAAGACFWRAGGYPVLLLGGSLLCCLRLWLNMLDGMVALASGKASRRGEIVNELPDRFSDVLIFVGIAHSGLCHLVAGYWTAIMALITAYVGIIGQAVGARREFGGVMSKPWRMATLIAGACVTAVSRWRGGTAVPLDGLSILDWTCLVIIFGCIQTIWLRLGRTMRVLRDAPDDAESE